MDMDMDMDMDVLAHAHAHVLLCEELYTPRDHEEQVMYLDWAKAFSIVVCLWFVTVFIACIYLCCEAEDIFDAPSNKYGPSAARDQVEFTKRGNPFFAPPV